MITEVAPLLRLPNPLVVASLLLLWDDWDLGGNLFVTGFRTGSWILRPSIPDSNSSKGVVPLGGSTLIVSSYFAGDPSLLGN